MKWTNMLCKFVGLKLSSKEVDEILYLKKSHHARE